MRNDLNFNEMNELTICNENIESNFVEITCSNKPITVGVLYVLQVEILGYLTKNLKPLCQNYLTRISTFLETIM